MSGRFDRPVPRRNIRPEAPPTSGPPGEGRIATQLGYRAQVYEQMPRIELRQLRYFLAVAEELSFTLAAKRMGIAQPPLSQQIFALEHQLGVKLFLRSKRQVSLTLEGETLVLYARRIINTTRAAAEIVQAVSKGEDGPLALGSIFSSIYTLIPVILPPFVQRYPGVKLHLQEMTISQQIAALMEERIDVGIVRGPIAEPDLETASLFTEGFVAVVPSGSPMADAATLSIEEIARQKLIRVYPSANRDYSRRMFAALIDKGYVLNIVQEVSDTHTLIGLVAAGIGVSLVPASFQNMQIRQVRYIKLREETPTTTLLLAWRKGGTSPTGKNFVRIAREIVAAVGPAPFHGGPV